MFDDEMKQKAKELVDFNDLSNGHERSPQSFYILEELAELSKEIVKDVLCCILTYSYSKNINIDDLRDIMIKKFDRGMTRLKSGEQ